MGLVRHESAIAFGCSIGFLGLAVLFIFTNIIALSIALVGLIVYVFCYSLFKYRSHYATLIGSIAGAVPPVIGYSGASACLDSTALLLFLMMVAWQMPHFFAIALYRLNDYAKGDIPVFPIVKGVAKTKKQIVFYIAAFIPLSCLIVHTHLLYFVVTLVFGLAWLCLALTGLKKEEFEGWAKKMFLCSLFVIMGFSFTIGCKACHF
jgi:protoheme IX farnesyltransferase